MYSHLIGLIAVALKVISEEAGERLVLKHTPVVFYVLLGIVGTAVCIAGVAWTSVSLFIGTTLSSAIAAFLSFLGAEEEADQAWIFYALIGFNGLVFLVTTFFVALVGVLIIVLGLSILSVILWMGPVVSRFSVSENSLTIERLTWFKVRRTTCCLSSVNFAMVGSYPLLVRWKRLEVDQVQLVMRHGNQIPITVGYDNWADFGGIVYRINSFVGAVNPYTAPQSSQMVSLEYESAW